MAAGLLLGGGATLTADAQTPGLQSEALEFVALAPDRILDTRNGTGAAGAGKLGAGQVIELDVAGRTLSYGVTIPNNARAVMVNATSTEASAPTFMTFYPSGQPRPNASTLNAVFGANSSGLGSENVPNMITVSIGANGNVTIFNLAGETHVLADIAGYYIPAGSGGGGIAGGPSDPTGPCTDGDVFLNTTTGQLFSCVNGAWVPGATLPGGPAGPPGPQGPPGFTPGTLPPEGLPVTIGSLNSIIFVPVSTFTAPVAGDYWLDAGVDAQLTGPTLGLFGEVECQWFGSGVIGPLLGEALTLSVTIIGLPVVGVDRGAFPVNAQAFDLDAGDTVTLQCRAVVLLAVGTSITVDAVSAALRVG